jgi:hypothetical protein
MVIEIKHRKEKKMNKDQHKNNQIPEAIQKIEKGNNKTRSRETVSLKNSDIKRTIESLIYTFDEGTDKASPADTTFLRLYLRLRRDEKDLYVRASEPLIEALKNNNVKVRCTAANYLSCIGDICVIESLIESLSDENIGVRCAAAKALTEIELDEIWNEKKLKAFHSAKSNSNENARDAIHWILNIGDSFQGS